MTQICCVDVSILIYPVMIASVLIHRMISINSCLWWPERCSLNILYVIRLHLAHWTWNSDQWFPFLLIIVTVAPRISYLHHISQKTFGIKVSRIHVSCSWKQEILVVALRSPCKLQFTWMIHIHILSAYTRVWISLILGQFSKTCNFWLRHLFFLPTANYSHVSWLHTCVYIHTFFVHSELFVNSNKNTFVKC